MWHSPSVQVGPSRSRYGQLRHVFGSTSGFEAMVSGNRVTLLHDGVQALPAMLEAIDSARVEILVEMYWFGSDKTGSRFAEALAEKARDGVRVSVLYDAVGSFDADRRMFDRLRSAGCQVHEYNPIAPWRAHFRLGVLNNRNHRKMLLVDREVGFTGGVNFGDPWAPEEVGGSGWRDDMVCVEGPAVEQMRRIFMHTWRDLDSRRGTAVSLPPPAETPRADEGSRVRVLANYFLGEHRVIRNAYLSRIRQARESVLISNAYFVPDLRIRRALGAAADRGVDVRVIVPGRSDVPVVTYAGRNLYERLLAKGIRLYQWRGRMLHAKTAVVDQRWCTVGTYNLDYRSWRFNLEVNVAIDDESVATAMHRRFVEDIENADVVSLATWKKRSMIERCVEKFCYLFRKMF